MPFPDLQLAQALEKSGADFLLIDLETALTFVSIARQEPPGSEKRARTQSNARRAYDTVVRLLAKLPEQPQRELIDAKLSTLKASLETLGERF